MQDEVVVRDTRCKVERFEVADGIVIRSGEPVTLTLRRASAAT
jgi:hypothetical protein